MNNLEAGQMVTGVTNALMRSRAAASARSKEIAYQQAREWVDSFVSNLQVVLDEEIAAFGLVHARRLVERLDSYVADWMVPGLEAMSRRSVESPTTLPQNLTEELRGLKGVLAQTHSITDKVRSAVLGATRQYITAEAQRVAAEALKEFSTGVVSPLDHALSRALTNLEVARRAKGEPPGLAVMETDLYSLWPFDGQEKVDKRWGASVNEVLLTKAESFGDLYPDHLARAVELPGSDRAEVRKTAIGYLIRGDWPITGGARTPGGLLTRRRKWVANALARRPGESESDIQQPAEYGVEVTAAKLLDRARAFVTRPGMAFENFASESLREYATDTKLSDSKRAERELEIANAFTSVLSLSLPLVGVEDESVQGVHGQPGSVQFNLSEIPFGATALEGVLRERIKQTPNLNDGFLARLQTQNPFSTDEHLRRIDVFGSYKCYAPIAYTGVLDPIARQWAEARMPLDRESFWRLRRARPIEAALPMSDAERRALIGGWLVGRILGAVVLPPKPFDKAVRVFDLETDRWVEFPNPLLTPPRRFHAADDWLPSVLESSLLAMTRYSDAPVGASLRPYQVLRRLWDQDPTGPTDVSSGMLELAGRDNLEMWVRGQVTIPAGSSPVQNADNPQDRAAAALDYLTSMVRRVETEYVKPDYGASSEGKHARLSNRREVVAAPFFRSIAPDVVAAARQMIEWLEATEWPSTDEAAAESDFDWSHGGV
ncbi:MAG TPA: hypothetical protein GX718_11475 [Brevibacterium sp.]|nr:hypothetical protein [Brevibacterium sp.]